jgi:hypothetical protein
MMLLIGLLSISVISAHEIDDSTTDLSIDNDVNDEITSLKWQMMILI